MSTGAVPPTFNWVDARKKCNARELFKRLRSTVEADVKEANRNREHKPYRFDVFSEDEFAVNYPHPSGVGHYGSVHFKLDGSQIVITDGIARKTMFSYRAHLVGEDCRFVPDGDALPLYAWQVSRLALEDVFFDD